MKKSLSFLILLILTITLSSCKKTDGVFIEIDDKSYEVIDVIDQNTQLLQHISDEDDLGDYVILPLYEEMTCYAKSGKVYNSYYIYYEGDLYSIIEAIDEDIVTSDFFGDLEEFDCVSHEYVIDGIIFDEVYKTEDYTLLVVRCRSEIGTDDIIDVGDVLNIHLYFSSGTYYSEYKVQFMEELYSIESALLLQIMTLEELLNSQLADLYFSEINCGDVEEFGYQPCTSGTTDKLQLIGDYLYRITGSFDEYSIMKNIREPNIQTADIRIFREGETTCSAGSSTNVGQYIIKYEDKYYSFSDFLELNVVSLSTIMENGGSPCMTTANNND